VHPFLYTDVGKDWLHDRQPSGIDALSIITIHLCFHIIDQVRLLGIDLNRKIPARSIRLAQTAGSQWTGGTVFRAGVVDIISTIAVALIAGMTSQFFSLRTKIQLLAFII